MKLNCADHLIKSKYKFVNMKPDLNTLKFGEKTDI